MNAVSEAAKARALALAHAEGMPDDGLAPHGPYTGPLLLSLARFIQQVSDALRAIDAGHYESLSETIAPFVLPTADGVQALDDIIRQRFQWHNAGRTVAEELAERGFAIVESGK